MFAPTLYNLCSVQLYVEVEKGNVGEKEIKQLPEDLKNKILDLLKDTVSTLSNTNQFVSVKDPESIKREQLLTDLLKRLNQPN